MNDELGILEVIDDFFSNMTVTEWILILLGFMFVVLSYGISSITRYLSDIERTLNRGSSALQDIKTGINSNSTLGAIYDILQDIKTEINLNSTLDAIHDILQDIETEAKYDITLDQIYDVLQNIETKLGKGN